MAKAVKKRAYDSPVRQEQAAQTRARIVEAAGELFESAGYARTTIRQIATAAGVAIDTVYATFGSKPRVLTALIDDRLSAGTGVPNVMERPEALAIRDEQDQARQLHLLARDLAAVVERVGPVFEIMRVAASVEPEMAGVYAEMQGYRAQNMRRAIEWVAARGPLRVDVDQAADTLWVLAAPDVARLLVHGKGWTSEQFAAWLEDMLVQALLPGPGRG
jgi:AcrR family transcriptional regulator